MTHRRPFLTTLVAALLAAGCGSGKKAPPPLTEDAAAAKDFLQETGLEKSNALAYVRGRIVVYPKDGHYPDKEVMQLLPPELKAITRDDVGTVVRLDWLTEEAPGKNYTMMKDGKTYRVPAKVWNVDVTVIDWKLKRIMSGRRIFGTPPSAKYESAREDTLNREGGLLGPRPTQEVADYLAELARSATAPN